MSNALLRLDEGLYHLLLLLWTGGAVFTFILLFFISAPYGKLKRKGWGPHIESRLAWILMEAVSWLGMLLLFVFGHRKGLVLIVFLSLWTIHYTYRAFIFPGLKTPGSAPMPAVIMFLGMAFNLGNVFFNGYYLFFLAQDYPLSWLSDLRFWLGVIIFGVGLYINISSDAILRRLRSPEDRSYKIPAGGLFSFVSCPNYLGEILEWAGWAIATWSLAGLSFMLWTIANLAPRALSYHAWYRKTFPDYPKERKALIPFFL